ncbi:hypothetical protein LR48_Vigan11g140600 [Vigna angularis]|uniref:Exocyst subunit Exo70 family protein n=1 Tax=Phaseolus angularis TaxID=3914 RepID=A0A0L9VU37_PHAAN|nr:hypothetical protein LR48_Vigan11g140600 [Vigna angularis]
MRFPCRPTTTRLVVLTAAVLFNSVEAGGKQEEEYQAGEAEAKDETDEAAETVGAGGGRLKLVLQLGLCRSEKRDQRSRSSRTSANSNCSDCDDDFVTEDDDIRAAGDSITEVEQVSSSAMADMKLIVDCMVSSGYAKECVSIYIVIRKSIIDEGFYRLGVEKLSSLHANMMDWEVLDLKIKSWLEAVRIAVRILFSGERILYDNVFSYSDSVRESCCVEISKDDASLLYELPELFAKTKKSSLEKLFRVLDMHAVASKLLSEIESIFSSDYNSAVRSQVLTSLQRLIESPQFLLTKIVRSSSKMAS